MYEALMEGNHIPTLTEIFSEDVVWHLLGAAPLSGDHRGREAVFAAMRQFEGSVQHELHDVLGNDEHAVALLRATGSRKDKQYNAMEIDVFHVREGKITEFWSFSEDQSMTDEYWS
ncbi:MAG: nuclear transport factor 2 family protein [Dehalococcoidia bacterium]